MKQKCEKLVISEDGRRAIYVDSANKKEILAYIQQDSRHKKKFRFISDIILNGHTVKDVYCREDIDGKCKDVTAMRFFVGQENDRIYCKEVKTEAGTLVVIASVLHLKKKSNNLSSKEISAIRKVANTEYDIEK